MELVAYGFAFRMTRPATTSTVGPRLRDARRYVRLSQTAVASFMGTTRQSVAAFERGTRSPDLTQLVKAANILRLTLDEMVVKKPSTRAVTPPPFRPRLNNRRGQLTDADAGELA